MKSFKCVSKSFNLSQSQVRFFSRSSSIQFDKIGFIGLGAMGSQMCPHLSKKAQHNVQVYDINPEAVQHQITQNSSLVSKAQTIEQLSENCDVIITMLPGPQHVKDVYEMILNANIKENTLLIDASTIDPATSQLVSKKALKKGLRMIDAPVSGGVGGANQGTLTFMVGGTQEDFERSKAYLGLMGKNIVHCGDSGMGQVAKICNNLVLGISMNAVCEGMVLGTQLGMDPQKLAGILNTSTGRCWSSDTYNPYPGVMEGVPSSRDYTGGFASKLMHKDLSLAIQAAEDAKIPLTMGKKAKEQYEKIMEHKDFADKDFSVVAKYIRENIGKE